MININTIEELFDYSSEKKNTDTEKKEKNNRRFESICRKVPEVRTTVYESKKGILQSIEIVNNNYSKILNEYEIKIAISELNSFYKIISNSHIDIKSKAYIIKSYDFKEYKKLLALCHLTSLKSILRLKNMKTMATKYLQNRFSKKDFSLDLKEQIKFFKELLMKYKDISAENCYVYILRYDLKTIKKKTGRIQQNKK